MSYISDKPPKGGEPPNLDVFISAVPPQESNQELKDPGSKESGQEPEEPFNEEEKRTESNDETGSEINRTKRYKVGTEDVTGQCIIDIFVITNEFVLYEVTSSPALQIYTADEHIVKEEERKHFNNATGIAKEIGRIHSLQTKTFKSYKSIHREFARGVALALMGNIDGSKEVLKEVEDRLVTLVQLRGRLDYQYGSFAASLIFLIAFMLLYILSEIFNLNQLKPYIDYAAIMASGSLGGFLSVSLGIRKLDIELLANRTFNFAAGASRILIAVVASIFVYFGIKSEIIISFFAENTTSSIYGIYTACFISGFSETFVPNIIRKLSKDKNNQENNKDQGNENNE